MFYGNPRIVDATFVSVWDGGSTRFETPCKVNLDTKQVFSIEMVPDDEIEDLEILEEEYIILPTGASHNVRKKEDAEPGDFWYDG